ncbi:uncharacterized protein ATNIH1004_005876 [Aspergillus tanneri]|uniref:DUF7082 domain-containing protein n=1 Tax=Aspergillus tanneri TaxID=1220188 RepID=A0A5M9MMP9_9EURO|nr:uncharacterized protein ATNIH1004_005876 [Aspergillus tanneri]KAA8647186.1 hypothetical protein ATNIH1004_005876 [Aspergillus tanneri]
MEMSTCSEMGVFFQDKSVPRSGQELAPSDHNGSLSMIVCDREALKPEVLYFLPDHGPEGTFVYFHLQSSSPLLNDPLRTHLIFGSCWVQTDNISSGFWCSKYQYSVTAYVHHTPNELDNTFPIPLWVMVHDMATLTPYVLYVGDLSYQPELGEPWATRNKRDSPRPLSTSVHGGQSIPCETFFELQVGVADSNSQDRLSHFMDIIEPLQRPYSADYNISASTTPVPSVIPGELPWGSSGASHSPLPITEMYNGDSSNPSSPESSTFSLLYINTPIIDMAYNWTREETVQRRRIVHFVRHLPNRQLIDINLSPPSCQRLGADLICISCIYWPGREELFITSSDIIRLFQWLLRTPILQLQRCRIRRNLDRFQPHLISKSDPESFEFARMIRGFRNPRAVAVQKDMKIFPWRILQTAITNILHKHDIQVLFPACGRA